MTPKIIFFGTPSFVVPVLKSILENFELVGVVNAPDTIQGRKKLLTASPIKLFMQDSFPNIPVFSPEKLSNETVEQLIALNPDLFIVAAYGKIIPKRILEIPKYGALNIHPSLLPKYRGPSPIQTALLNGDEKTGVSIIQMDEKMDHGPLVAQWEKDILPEDTFATLHTSLFADTAERLPEIITDYLSKKITLITQDEAAVSFCKMITRESGYFDISNPPTLEKLDRMIRAYFPWPTAWTKIDGKIIKFYPDGKIQMEGKNIVGIKEFMNGYPELKPLLEKLLETQN